MNININTTNKTITLNESVNLKELFEQLLDMQIDMDEYEIVANKITYSVKEPSPWVGDITLL